MKYLLASIVLSPLFALPAIACDNVAGTYSSVSETHWNFTLKIDKSETELRYTDYSFGDDETKTKTEIERTQYGYCEHISDNKYQLTFAEQSFIIQYDHELSKESFGEKGYAPGFVADFIENTKVELWLTE
ncbi:hypothetical protein FE810_05295 [Thalassotalea litorea]|uniref:DUF3757 domain-containing protein n=1 Tax=Thalassotalea litorea TaxID=2020715 RepID=A0A5R9INS0_9GAMM|nr:hypothetical protein [Thalassotalea litorea]TLU66922.1 hypothetical protein FE810_05295 [Thalassotalea litorea]